MAQAAFRPAPDRIIEQSDKEGKPAVAELIERMLAVLIVIILLGIVLYLAINDRFVATTQKTSPAPAPIESVQYAKKVDRLREATPAELRRDWSRSPTIVIREPAEPPRIIRERERAKPAKYRHSEYRHSDYRASNRYREEPPAEYRDRTVYKTYNEHDCSGDNCSCTCDRPYWSSSGPACWD